MSNSPAVSPLGCTANCLELFVPTAGVDGGTVSLEQLVNYSSEGTPNTQVLQELDGFQTLENYEARYALEQLGSLADWDWYGVCFCERSDNRVNEAVEFALRVGAISVSRPLKSR